MPWCTPPRAACSIAAASTRSIPIPFARASGKRFFDAAIGPRPDPHPPHAPRAQGLEDRVDAVDDHGTGRTTSRHSSVALAAMAPANAIARSRHPMIGREAGRGGNRGAAVDRRHGEIELGAAAFAGQGDADRMEQGFPL